MPASPATRLNDESESRLQPLGAKPDARLPVPVLGGPAAIAAAHSCDNLTKILRAVRSTLGMDVGFVAEFKDGQRVFRSVDAAESGSAIQVGGSTPLEESCCQRVVDGRLPELIPDIGAASAEARLPQAMGLEIGAQLCVPIRLWDGRVYGTFCCFSAAPDPSLDDRDLQMMRAFAELAAFQIDRELEVVRRREQARSLVKGVIERDQLSIVYQPIYSLERCCIAGFECLTRFAASPSRSPDVWFSEAAEIGLSTELELAAIRIALPGLTALPASTYVAINVSPETLVSEELWATLQEWPAARVVLEVTEHTAVSDYADVSRALQALRDRGLRIAVDDAGAGYASFRHILNLRPELIKLDISLTRNIDSDPARRALASALIGFAQVTSSEIVAEGVETASELAALRSLGVGKAQGYLLGRPMPLGDASQLFVADPAQAVLRGKAMAALA